MAAIGMRRTGKTTFLWQVLAGKVHEGASREALLYFGFEDERLGGLTAADLQLIVEEYYRLQNIRWQPASAWLLTQSQPAKPTR